MHILTPHLSCVVDPNGVDAAVAEGYSKIYIVAPNGLFLHHKLSGENRYLRLKTETIPNYTPEQPPVPNVKEVISFLPAGKIPYTLFEQIVAFFKKVSAVKKSELEAMAWIMWSAERGYFVTIPEQTISKASVSYDWASIPPGCQLIVDIHSHNTMGAFFSGTDNADDRSNISYSGVVGQLDKDKYATVWRFNYLDRKYEASMEAIFAAPEAMAVPDEWIDKVQTRVYTPPPYYKGTYIPGGTTSGKGKADHLAPHQFPKSQENGHGRGPFPGNPYSPTNSSASSIGQTGMLNGNRAGPAFQGRQQGLVLVGGVDVGERASQESDPRIPTDRELQKSAVEEAYEAFYESYGYDAGFQFNTENNFSAGEGGLSMDEVNRRMALGDDPADAHFGESHLGNVSGGNDASDVIATLVDGLISQNFSEDSRFPELACSLGPDVASAYMFVEGASFLFEGQDTQISQIMSEYFQQMTPEGQSKFFRELFQDLPREAREKIEQNGF